MTPDELKRQIDRLAERLTRIEQRLGLEVPDESRPDAAPDHPAGPPIPATGAPAEAPFELLETDSPETPQKPPAGRPPRVAPAVEPPIMPAGPFEPDIPRAIPVGYAGSEAADVATGAKRPTKAWERMPWRAPPTTPPTHEPPPLPAAPPAPGRRAGSLELQIGMKWMAWAGAILVVAAAGFFVKLGFDRGWWGKLSPLVKCLIAAGFGAALLAAGEWALRRINRFASVSLFSAGLGVLYLVAFSTFKYFELLPESGARWLMVLVALIGVAITVRGRSLTIGVLALLGGYLAPLILHEQATFAAGFPLYTTGLLAIGLTLSAVMPQPFRPLRYVTMAIHGGVAGLWVLTEGTTLISSVAGGSAHWLMALVFMTLWWAMVSGEALYGAARGQSALGNAVASLFATIWFAGIGCLVIGDVQADDRNWLGVFALGIATVAGLTAFFFGPGLDALRKTPTDAVRNLAVALWAEAGVLVATAIGLQFKEASDSYGQTIGWMAMAVVCIEAGRRLRSRGVDVFGFLVGALALFRVWTVDPGIPALKVTVWSGVGLTINYWSLLALASVAATHFVSRRFRSESPRPVVPGLLAILGTLSWMALCVAACSELTWTTAWLLGAAALLAAGRFGARQWYVGIAHFVLAATAAKWLLLDAIWPRLGASWDPNAVLPLANVQMALALAVTATAWWAAALRARPLASPHAIGPVEMPSARPSLRSQLVRVSASLFLVLSLCFEVDRLLARLEATDGWDSPWPPGFARLLWVTLLWSVGGLAMHIYGALRREPGMYATGGCVVLATGVAWLSAGTVLPRAVLGATLTTVARNAQFAVGALLIAPLAVAVWFARGRRPATSVPDALVRAGVIAAYVLLGALPLWLVTLEIDRHFALALHAAAAAQAESGAAMARQTAFSVYWGAYAIALVALGFRVRSRWCRYAGLGLLAVTLGKVLIADTKHLDAIYRVASLLAVGLLAMATSVAYAKLASRLLATDDPEEAADWAEPRA